MVEVELFDGTRLQFPDGTSQDVISRVGKQKTMELRQRNNAPTDQVLGRKGDTRLILKGGKEYLVSPGYSTGDPEKIAQFKEGMTAGEISKTSIDEGLIAANPVAARAQEFARGTLGVGSYLDEGLGWALGEDAKLGARALSGAMQRQRPGQTMALNMAGGISSAAGLGAAVPQIGAAGDALIGQGSRAARFIRGGLTGSVGGGAEGLLYGSGEGDNAQGQSRGETAVSGAGYGALFGGIGGAAVPLIQDAGANLMNYLKGTAARKIAAEFNISEDAAKVIKTTFDQGGDIDSAIANLQRAGEEGMLADAGRAAQSLLDGVANAGGRAKATALGAVDERMVRSGNALTAKMDDVLGPASNGPMDALDTIAERTKAQRTDLYGRAYSSPIDYSTGAPGEQILDVIYRTDPDVVMRAIKRANNAMNAKNITNQQIMASIGDDGRVVFTEPPNVRMLDELKKELQGLAFDTQSNPMTGKLTGEGQITNDLARQLRDATTDAVPVYGEAVALGGDKLAEQRAYILGQNLLRSSTEVEDVGIVLGRNPSAAQIDAAKMGLRTDIAKTMGDVRMIMSNPNPDEQTARQAIKAMIDMSSDNARAKILGLLGEEEAAIIFRQLDETAASAGLRANTALNSLTAARIAQKEAIDEVTAPGPLAAVARGKPVDAVQQGIAILTQQTGEFTAAQRQKIYQDIARALTEKRGPEAVRALKALQAAIDAGEVSDEEVRALAGMVSRALAAGSATNAGRGTTR